MRTLFISGTDTGVGKTLASALLCRFLLKTGKKVAYYKPVQTGAEEIEGQLISVDTEYVKSLCPQGLKVIDPVMFKLPASPHLAAEEENTVVNVADIINTVEAVSGVDFLVVEGAGGLAVPLTYECDMAELCQKINAELVLVCRANLGTLNHTFLSVDYAKRFGLKPSVIISGCHENPDVIEADNLKMIAKKCEGQMMGYIPQVDGLDTEDFSGEKVISVQFEV